MSRKLAAATVVLAISFRGATCHAAPAAAARAQSKPLEVATWAGWPSFSHSLLLETSEFLAEEDGALFWAYASAAWKAAPAASVLDDAAAATHLAFSLAGTLVAPLTYDVLRLAVQSRAYSPAVETQRQLCDASRARTGACGGAAAWAELSTGEIACDAAQLTALASSAAAHDGGVASSPAAASIATLYDGDHVYPAATPALAFAAESRPVAVVCGSLGDAIAAPLHAAAAAAAAAGSLRYVWRHYSEASSTRASNVTWLAGYGVGLDVKSTEYKFMNDDAAGGARGAATGEAAAAFAARVAAADETLPQSWVAAAYAAARSGADAGAATRGVLFDAFDGPTAAALRAALDAAPPTSTAAAPPLDESRLPPWETGNLGMQAAAWIVSGGSSSSGGGMDDPLVRLESLTGNFPSLAPYLATLPVSDALKSEVAGNARLVATGTSLMTVNGIAVEPSAPTFNLFALFNVLRSEARVAATFAALPLHVEDRRRVAALAIAGSKESLAAAEAAAAAESGGDAAAEAEGDEEDEGGVDPGAAARQRGGGGGGAGGPLRVDVWVDAELDYVVRDPVAAAVPPAAGKRSAEAEVDADGADLLPHPFTIITWLNDIEGENADEAFQRWPTTLRALLMPAWQLHQIRRNLYNIVIVGDLASPAGMRALMTASHYLGMRVPLRFGLLPLAGAADAVPTEGPLTLDVEADLSGLQFALLHTAAATRYGPDAAAQLVTTIASTWAADLQARTRAAIIEAGGDPDAQRSAPPPPVAERGIGVAVAAGAYAEIVTAMTDSWSQEAGIAEAQEVLLDANGRGRALVAVAAAWAGERSLPASGCVILNGRVSPGLDLQSGVMPLIGEEMQLLQRIVHSGAIDDNVSPSVYAAVLGHAAVHNARGARLAARRAAAVAAGLPPPPPSRRANLPTAKLISPAYQPAAFAADAEQRFLALSAAAAAPLRAAARYVCAPGTSDEVKPVSLLIVDDLSTQEGVASLVAALAVVRGGGGGAEKGTQLPPEAAAVLVAPRRATEGVAAALRVAPLHVPTLASSAHAADPDAAAAAAAGTPSAAAVGHFVTALWAAVTGACARQQAWIKDEGEASGRGAPLVYFRVSDDDQAPILGVAVDAVWRSLDAEAATGGAEAAAAAVVTALNAFAAANGTRASAARSALRLAQAVPLLVSDATQSADAAAAPCIINALRSSRAAVDAARALIPAVLPEARIAVPSQAAAGVGGMRIRAVSVNGRVLALGDARGGKCTVPMQAAAAGGWTFVPGGAADSAPSSSSSNTVLPPCLGPVAVSVLTMAERAARGAHVAALLATSSFPDIDPDDATSAWVSDVVALSAAAVGASLHVASGALGGLSVGRTALRTHLLAGNYTSFTSGPAATAVSADGQSGADAEASPPALASLLQVSAIVDPLSEDATRIAPLLRLLRDRLGATVTVHLVPPPHVPPTPPLRSFYRFVMPSDYKPAAGAAPPSAAAAWQRPVAAFAWLPPSSILTLKHYVPEAWNTQAAAADVDLDNLRLADVPAEVGAVAVEYALRDILVAGQCVDVTGSGATTPNGLQLQLTRAGAGAQSDTLVMQNLGYWQLKAASPGVFGVSLAPGRGADLFDIVASSGVTGAGGGRGGGYAHIQMGRRGDAAGAVVPLPAGLSVVVRDFTGPITQLTVRKRAGKEAVPLLAPVGAPASDVDAEVEVAVDAAAAAASSGGVLSSLSRRLFGGSDAAKAAATHATGAPSSHAPLVHVNATAAGSAGVDTRPPLHVFSLASGHLYERFLKIMMLSASKRTPGHRITFWLLENTLSPAFKRAIPALTTAHNFDVRYVTYKWPNWLRQQSEKQRIIWGYKILFLDVLFPLNLTKVIYVDSDQVVRADLAELWNMDLQGAPYAYTPFCDSRAETLGYQFWRKGYWADHLAGKPYHISALYVVDLLAFRRAAVGDILRSTYDTLSRDPNSLSNLDQDLPNYAQNLVPIHSLPQSWLWCESWCSDDSKAEAKTIDLCNNPRFKEPKLDMAKRVISGPLFPESWIELDDEVKRDEAAYAARVAAA